MTGARAAWLALALVAGGACVGCVEQRRRFTAETTVRAYNDALVRAYRLSDVAPLLGVAGRREIGRVQVLIDLKRASHLVLESSLESFSVVSVDPSGPEGLTVRTRERWRYHDRATRPGQPVGPVFVADMEMEWHLRREDGAWKVEHGRTLESRYVEPRGFAPGAAAAAPAAPAPEARP